MMLSVNTRHGRLRGANQRLNLNLGGRTSHSWPSRSSVGRNSEQPLASVTKRSKNHTKTEHEMVQRGEGQHQSALRMAADLSRRDISNDKPLYQWNHRRYNYGVRNFAL